MDDVPDDDVRKEARRRLEERRGFSTHVVTYLLVNGMLVAIWAMSGAGFFWPIFPILGWGIGIAFHAWDTFRRSEPTEARVQREMEHLRRS